MDKEIGGDCNNSLMASVSGNYWKSLDANNEDKEVSSLRGMHLDMDSLSPKNNCLVSLTLLWAYAGVRTKVSNDFCVKLLCILQFYVTCSNRLACSEIREFEYLENPTKSVSHVGNEIKPEDEVHEGGKGPNMLDAEGQGVIHLAAGLGYVWAMAPLVNAGINPNFRDAHGRTGLHWASHFRRPDSMGNYFLVPIYISNFRDVFTLMQGIYIGEETVIALVKLGAVPGLVDDPKSAFPRGKTAADLDSSRGYKGIAGYLAEADLVNQLSRLTVNENEKDNIATNLATDNAFESADTDSSKMTMDEQCYLRESLAAFQKSAYAAASI
ncbi:hypothetical protein Ahy_B09g097638 [Arachis hypogaea]|uniref:Uncharacterized protein n=1 Tax=Arachis hypogaea TaxID=3818 RepID=A0A444XPH8_ARAHY|nr:hypothetical protein Ahy_B09g097638 [Arachis hypogaea]